MEGISNWVKIISVYVKVIRKMCSVFGEDLRKRIYIIGVEGLLEVDKCNTGINVIILS